MASSSAEASSYTQGFGVTRRRDQPSLRLRLGKQDGATSWGKEIRGPAFAKATAGKLRSAGENADCGSQIMAGIRTRFSVVADQVGEEENAFALVIG